MQGSGSANRGLAFFSIILVGLVSGCAEGPYKRLGQCRRYLDQAQEQNRHLRERIVGLDKTVADQSRQIETLQSLGTDRLGNLATVKRIQLEHLTGPFSSEDKVGHDGIVIYLQPVDADGHVIKAAGKAAVQLLDLANPDSRHLLGQWRFDADQLRKLWVGRFWTHHYTIRCVFPTRPEHEDITVRVEFTELLTGKTFTAQKLCRIKLPPTAD